MYNRGQPADYDHWESLGNPGWGWNGVLPYFRKCEDCASGGDAYRGRGGPLHVADVSRDMHPLCQVYLKAGEEAGLPCNTDFNGAEQEGVGLYQITTRNGIRMSTARAYLRLAADLIGTSASRPWLSRSTVAEAALADVGRVLGVEPPRVERPGAGGAGRSRVRTSLPAEGAASTSRDSAPRRTAPSSPLRGH